MHPDNRGSNTDNFKNVLTTFVVHPIHEIPIFDLVKHAHIEKKLWRWGGYMAYALDFGWALYIWTLYMNFVYKFCIYFGRGLFLFWMVISIQAHYRGYPLCWGSYASPLLVIPLFISIPSSLKYVIPPEKCDDWSPNQNCQSQYQLLRGKWKYTYIIRYSFQLLIVRKNIPAFVMFVNTFNILLSSQNLKNNDINQSHTED